mgnify:CR=1 FL=1
MQKRPFIYDPPIDPPYKIIYQDDDLLVLDKPAGLLSVPGRPAEHKDSLSARIQTDFPSATVVHRLDLATSGLMIMPLNHTAHKHLGQQLEYRKVSKTYIADIFGQPVARKGIIEAPMIVDWPNRPRQIIDFDNGKKAVTHWRLLKEKENVSRVLLKPVTGRTHQLRVHMQYLGHPILGDDLYAHDDAYDMTDRLHLHAAKIRFVHPKGHWCRFTSEVPF